jgi:hypothetical protein
MDKNKQNIAKSELHAERLITELILMGKIYTRPVAPHVKIGLRFKFKWKQDVWYSGVLLVT